MTAEVIAFSDLFDVCLTLAEELKDVYGRKFPVQLFTDSRSLFDNISKGSRTSEKRMMIDIAAAREGFKNKLISDFGFVRTNHMLADGLTKSMSQVALQEVLCTAKYRAKVEQWIVRDSGTWSLQIKFADVSWVTFLEEKTTCRISTILRQSAPSPPHIARVSGVRCTGNCPSLSYTSPLCASTQTQRSTTPFCNNLTSHTPVG